METTQLEAVKQALAVAGSSRLGLLLLHVQRRRQIQAHLGLQLSERLQGMLAERLQQVLRPDDRVLTGALDTEIMVLLPDLLSPGHAQMAALRILREFDQPVEIEGHTVLLGLTIGLAIAPDHALAGEELARAALLALDEAEREGQRFAMAVAGTASGLRVEDLRRALLENEMTLAFQPQLDLRSGQIVAVEALARWDHPELGDIAPELFIGMAERMGLSTELTRWSLNAALREHAQLRRQMPELGCAVNLSPKIFGQSGLIEQILGALRLWDLPPRMLTVEVTETAVLEDADYSGWVLAQLHAAGVDISIDDFGRGYSSFSYFKHFPARELKIDQLFVTQVAADESDLRIVRSMIELAHNLGMRALAEGVEDAQALRLLTEMGCDRAQGFHIGRPRPVGAGLEGWSPVPSGSESASASESISYPP